MAKFSREKGKRGELELRRLLIDELGEDLVGNRRLDQYQQTGHDLDVGGWAVEVKRHARLTRGTIRKYYNEALRGTGWAGRFRVALAYRSDGDREWRFVFAADALRDDEDDHWYLSERGADYDWAVEVGIKLFCELVRENA